MHYNFDFDKKYEKINGKNIAEKESFRAMYKPQIFDNENVFNLVYNTPERKQSYYAREELKKVLSDLYFDPKFAENKNPIEETRRIIDSIYRKHSTFENSMSELYKYELYNHFKCLTRNEERMCGIKD